MFCLFEGRQEERFLRGLLPRRRAERALRRLAGHPAATTQDFYSLQGVYSIYNG